MSRPAIRICKRLVAPGAASRARCPPCRAERVPSAGAGGGVNLDLKPEVNAIASACQLTVCVHFLFENFGKRVQCTTGLYRTPGALQAAPRLCERIRPTYRTVLLLPYYSTRCLLLYSVIMMVSLFQDV